MVLINYCINVSSIRFLHFIFIKSNFYIVLLNTCYLQLIIYICVCVCVCGIINCNLNRKFYVHSNDDSLLGHQSFCSMTFCSTSTNNKRSHCFEIVYKDASLRIKMIHRCHVLRNCSCHKNVLHTVITCGKEKKNGEVDCVLIVSHSSNKDILNQSVCIRVDCTFTPLNFLQKHRNISCILLDSHVQITQAIFQSLNI